MRTITLTLFLSGFLILTFGCSNGEDVSPSESSNLHDSLEPMQRPSDFYEPAEAFLVSIQNIDEQDSLLLELPDPVGMVTLSNFTFTNDLVSYPFQMEGTVTTPHSGFFIFQIHENYFEGFIQSNNPRNSYRIQFDEVTQSHLIRRVTDSDELEGSMPLIPPSY